MANHRALRDPDSEGSGRVLRTRGDKFDQCADATVLPVIVVGNGGRVPGLDNVLKTMLG
jgi:hypothetical protein